jgi:hypothetical protein
LVISYTCSTLSPFFIFPKSKLLSDKAIEVDGSLETGAAASPETATVAEQQSLEFLQL